MFPVSIIHLLNATFLEEKISAAILETFLIMRIDIMYSTQCSLPLLV